MISKTGIMEYFNSTEYPVNPIGRCGWICLFRSSPDAVYFSQKYLLAGTMMFNPPKLKKKTNN